MTTAPATIKAQVDASNAKPRVSEASRVFTEENAKKIDRGLPEGIATPGNPFPDGRLLTAHGAETTYRETVGTRPSVAIFYRGAWCPVCNIALRTYNDTLSPELRTLGVDLVAISPQKPNGSLTMKEKNDLDFTVLSDPGNQLATQLGVLSPLTAVEVATQKSLGLDVEEVNADGTSVLPFPTGCVTDADGIIAWIDVQADYSHRAESSEILAAVHALLGR